MTALANKPKNFKEVLSLLYLIKSLNSYEAFEVKSSPLPSIFKVILLIVLILVIRGVCQISLFNFVSIFESINTNNTKFILKLLSYEIIPREKGIN